MANELQNEPQEQEIDLIDLIGRACRWTGNLIEKVFKTVLYFFVRNRYWYLLLLAIIVVTSLLSHKTSTKQYTCRMIVETRRVNAKDVINLINNWNYTNYNNDDNILSIHGCYLLDYNRDGIEDKIEPYSATETTDTTILNRRLTGRFAVEARMLNAVYDSVLADVKNKILDYISNDAWVIDRNERTIKEQKAMIARMEKEMEQLDSLKNAEYFQGKNQYKLDKNGGLMMVNEKDKHLYHGDIITLLAQKQSIEHNLYDEPFRVVQDFMQPMQEDNNLSAITKKNGAIIFLLGTIVILFIDNRKKIKPLIEKSTQKE